MRAIMKAEFGWDPEYVDNVRDSDLCLFFDQELYARGNDAKHEADLPGWIEAGYVTQDQADGLSVRGLRRLAVQVASLERFRGEAENKVSKARVNTSVTALPPLTRSEELTLHAQMLAIIAAQQTQLDELRKEVAILRNANLAVFGEQQVIDQLTKVPRDFEGVDITMTLEEQGSQLDESSSSGRETRTASLSDAADTTGAIEGLASLVAGLNANRATNLTALNEVARRMSERSKVLVKTRSKGTVRVKIARVSGGKGESEPSTVAVGSGAHVDREVDPRS